MSLVVLPSRLPLPREMMACCLEFLPYHELLAVIRISRGVELAAQLVVQLARLQERRISLRLSEAALDPRLVDLLRKTSHDPVLLKVPLRVLRDEILTRYDASPRVRVRTGAASTSRASTDDDDDAPPPDDVAALFALFDGAHRVCVTLASRLTAGPYETVDRALRLR